MLASAAPGLRVEHVGTESAVRARQPCAAGRQQVDGAVVFQQRDVRMCAGSVQKRPLDLTPRGVPVVEDSAHRVAALPPECESSIVLAGIVALAIELDAQLSEGFDGEAAAFHDEAHHVLVAEAGAGIHGVLGVGLEGVLVGNHRRDAALGEVRRRLRCLLLGDHRHSSVLRDAEGVEEAGDAAAEHQKVGIVVS
jgi:hypothetical protein